MIMVAMVAAINTDKTLEVEIIVAVVVAETIAVVAVAEIIVAAVVAETIAVAVAEITTTGILKKDINLQSELKQHLHNMEVLFFKK
jgi:hypothetical protein